ncbi:MAG: SpaA isopeptide-forming pilin-related protein [Acutalibacteraceae bacterium]
MVFKSSYKEKRAKSHFSKTKIKHTSVKIFRTMASIVLVLTILSASFSVLDGLLSADAAILGEGQTAFRNVSHFQQYRWAKIQKEIFNVDAGTKENPTVHNPSEIYNKSVSEGNAYFNWVYKDQLTGLQEWDGGSTAVTPLSETQSYDYDGDGNNNVEYTVYNVDTPQKFRYVLENINTLKDSSGNNAVYIKLNLLSDLNMAGYNNKQWEAIETNYCVAQNMRKCLYIEGNGHTIYNLKIVSTNNNNGAGLFSRPPAFMIVKNLGFRSSMVLNTINQNGYNTTAGLLCAFSPQKFYFYNVHSSGGYYQVYSDNDPNNQTDGGIGGLVGRKNIYPATLAKITTGGTSHNMNKTAAGVVIPFLNNDVGDCFMKNCSTSDSYMYGSDHIGGITSWFGTEFVAKCKYSDSFPATPEKYVVDRSFIENMTTTTSKDDMESNNYYPLMFENCSSTDCEIFSTGHDSGALISCGRGLHVKNCFTNNRIYANDNTGGFVGRLGSDKFSNNAGKVSNGIMHDDNDKCTLSDYFENCYSSGVVEGKEAMGGFVGLDNSARARRELYKSATDASILNTVGKASTAFVNCYSTAMVGMDYAGKYCGGFIGLDDNYNQGITNADGTVSLPTITVTNLDEGNVKNNNKKYSGRGNFYINCYAGGEVGNILTVTDTDDAKTREKEYMSLHENNNNLDDSGNPQILDYYPTGGFVGAIAVEGYNKNFLFQKSASESVQLEPVGNFYNCYYDMQTTAMHEMAVGLYAVKTSRDKANKSDFQLTGVTGLYTESSYEKGIPGLTGTPEDYTSKNGKKFCMDSGTDGDVSKSTVWNYNSQYYPQLSVYMTTDTSLDNIQTATADDIADAKKSPFFISDVSYDTDNEHQSSPVYSMADSKSSVNAITNKDKLNTTAVYAAQLAQVVRAFRFSQASTSTVLLNHWDVTMDTKSGTVGQENNWKTDVPSNRMTPTLVTDSDTGYKYYEWSVNYENVQAGNYEFKVTTPNWTYNYGVNGNNGSNMVLEVPEDDCNVKIRFYCNAPKSKDFYVKADITRPSKETYTKTLAEGEKYEETPYTVAGDFPTKQWEPKQNELYTMTHTGDRETYTLTIKNLPARYNSDNELIPYYFKITNGAGWTYSWGVDGVSSNGVNMSFVLTDTADVTITFSEKTHLTKVTATPAENLTDVITQNKVIDFTGYSAVFSSPIFAGHYWLDKDSDKVKEACEDGQLTYNEHTGLYERTFDVTISNAIYIGRNYSYKVIKDALDKGSNRSFRINDNVSVGDTIHVKVTYNPNTMESTIESVGSNAIAPKGSVENYSVIGAESLTGYNWMSVEAAQAGLMDNVDGSTTLLTKTYENVPKGTYDFKIAADCLDGNWSGLEWGGAENGNYLFELSDTANVEIRFDTVQEKIIVQSPALVRKQWVLTGGKTLMGESIGAWNVKEPVMTYNSETGLYEYTISNVPINSTKKVPEDQSTETPNYNYACKVIEYNNDQNEPNILFTLKEGTQKSYKLKFEYDETFKTLSIRAYDKRGKDVTAQVLSYDVEPYFYSVLGSYNLTKDSWGTMFPAQSAYNGWMEYDNNNKIYTKTYTIKLPEDGSVEQYSFKVVANGTFDSGLSWGTETAENIIVSVASNTISETTLTINFKPETGKVTYTLGNDVEYNDDRIVWYVAGTYMLRSNNGHKVSTKVYDTVRDITSGFTFTSGGDCKQKGILWSKNSTLNTDYGFTDNVSFDLNYNQFSNRQKNDIHTTFKSDVIKLDVEALGDINTTNPAEELTARFNCSGFMPGKQWISVTTAGYGYSNTFNTWKKQYLKYAEYTEKKEFYEKQLDLHLSVVSGYKFVDDDNNTVVISDEDTLLAYLRKFSGSEKDAAKELAKRFHLEDGVTLLDLKAELDSYGSITKPADTPTFSDTAITGSRNIRLIPTAYLEAGDDARIEVRQPDADEKYDKMDNDKVVNSVKYYSKDSAVSTIGGNAIDNMEFSYYNFAVTAGYLITDRVGLGIYKNYDNQKIIAYNGDAAEGSGDYIRDDSSNDVRNSGTDGTSRYFSMKSAFNNTDKISAGTYTDDGSRSKANLSVQKFKTQSTIGSSYIKSDDIAQTIVKIYKTVYENGVARREIVNTDPTPNATSDPALAYQKWTGQKNFVAGDEGDYVVQFCWTLSDGRYLQSEKNVTVLVYEPNISLVNSPKYDGETHFEHVYDDSGSVVTSSELKTNNTIKYKISYSNQKMSSDLTFAVLDILPFNGSTRVYTDLDGNIDKASYTSKISDSFKGFTLKNIKIIKSNITTAIKGFYYTTSDSVKSWVTNNDEKDAAKNLKLTKRSDYEGYIGEDLDADKTSGGIFKSFKKKDGATDYASGDSLEEVIELDEDIKNITAIAFTGVQLGIRETIDVEFEVEYEGKANDLIFNSANYHAYSRDMETDTSGTLDQSNIVSTTVVTRNLEGFAWLDSNKDGVLDEGEPRLENVAVSLYEVVNNKAVPTDVPDVLTDENGRYYFENLPQGNYTVRFTKPTDEDVKAVDGTKKRVINFNGLAVSKAQKEFDNVYDENGNVKADTQSGSVNLAVDQTNGTKAKTFGIPDIILPDDYSVGRGTYSHSNTTSINYTQANNDFVYNRTNKNAGFYEFYSVTINKVDQNNNAVAGAEFMLEYKNGDNWYPVYYDDDGYAVLDKDNPKTADDLETTNTQYIFPTDKDGYVKFDNLFEADFRFTEVSAPDGLGKLQSSVYFSLPYEVKESDLAEYSKKYYVDVQNGDSENSYLLIDGVRYYNNVKFKVSNPNKQFNLPQTGGFDGWYIIALIAGLILFVAGTGFILIANRKKSKKQND